MIRALSRGSLHYLSPVVSSFADHTLENAFPRDAISPRIRLSMVSAAPIKKPDARIARRRPVGQDRQFSLQWQRFAPSKVCSDRSDGLTFRRTACFS